MPNNQSVKIAIASGKGGTGKTFVATNLFNVLRKADRQVTLIDCDAEEPNVLTFISGGKINQLNVTQEVPVIDMEACVYCGKCAEYCSYNAIFFVEDARIIQVMDDLCHGCGACFVACEYDAISPKDDLLGTVSTFQVSEKARLIESRMKVGVQSPVAVIKAAIKQANDTEIVLMDSPPGTSCPFIQTVNKADYVVLITEPTPFGLSDLKQSVETLKTMHKPVGVIVNRAGLGDDAVYAYLEEEGIPLLIDIPFDRKIASLYSNGKLLTEEDADWERKFSDLFNLIRSQHGNSHH